MGAFSTRNNDGASGLGEPCNTVTAAQMRRLSDTANRHNPGKAAVFGDEATRFRKAHDRSKAGEN
jgi:hypothetical protein